jgi:hypothetical protein
MNRNEDDIIIAKCKLNEFEFLRSVKEFFCINKDASLSAYRRYTSASSLNQSLRSWWAYHLAPNTDYVKFYLKFHSISPKRFADYPSHSHKPKSNESRNRTSRRKRFNTVTSWFRQCSAHVEICQRTRSDAKQLLW